MVRRTFITSHFRSDQVPNLTPRVEVSYVEIRGDACREETARRYGKGAAEVDCN
jgi:hypothetical protein